MSNANRNWPPERASDEDLIETVKKQTEDKPVTITNSVVEDVPLARRRTFDRLTELAEKGEIEKLEEGRTTLWWYEE